MCLFIITESYDTCHPYLSKTGLLSLRKQAVIISFPSYQTPFIAIKKIFWLGSAGRNFSLKWMEAVIRVIRLQAATSIDQMLLLFLSLIKPTLSPTKKVPI